ncbi:MAG: hypothetical protein ACTSRI_04990 [Promethearchaeota archaeon]
MGEKRNDIKKPEIEYQAPEDPKHQALYFPLTSQENSPSDTFLTSWKGMTLKEKISDIFPEKKVIVAPEDKYQTPEDPKHQALYFPLTSQENSPSDTFLTLPKHFMITKKNKPSYPDNEVRTVWKPLFEKHSNYKDVVKELNKLYGRTETKLAQETISKRIKKLYKNQEDYLTWYNRYADLKIYPDDHIRRIWKPFFETEGRYNAVRKKLTKQYGGKPPAVDTIIRRLKKLFRDYPNYFEESTYLEWFVKYTKQYTEKVVKYWIKLFEEYKNYRLVKEFLESLGGRVPTITTIRTRVQGYFKKHNKNYFNWIKLHESTSHYYLNDVLIWKYFFEEIGTYRGVALRFEQIDGRLPTHKNIKKRIQKLFDTHPQYFIEHSFEDFEGKHGRYYHSNPIIKRWIKLFKNYGSFYSVLKIEKSKSPIEYRLPSNAETMKKQVQDYLKEEFKLFYKKFHNPTSIPLKREKIIKELHKNPPQSFTIIAKKIQTNRHTISKYAAEIFDPITYEKRWYNYIPLDLEKSIIDDILNTELTLRAMAEK